LIEFKHVDKVYPNGTKGLVDVNLTIDQGRELFDTMCENTREYLAPYYPQF
jgi:ABC-type ATPase involved in cell division